MKIAFDVDVLSKQMSINDLVHQAADWGYKYIEQSPHPRINPFYKHPLFSKECEEEYRKALKETGVEISSFICVYRWSGPTEEQRKMAVANWKKMIEIAVNMGVPVINTELSGDPNQQEICNGMWFRSMEELLPIIERAYQNGTIIVVCSQCSQGTVSLGTYASSAALHEVGAVNGHDMTTEAAFAKLYYLLSRSDDTEWVKGQLGRDLRGELTE